MLSVDDAGNARQVEFLSMPTPDVNVMGHDAHRLRARKVISSRRRTSGTDETGSASEEMSNSDRNLTSKAGGVCEKRNDLTTPGGVIGKLEEQETQEASQAYGPNLWIEPGVNDADSSPLDGLQSPITQVQSCAELLPER